MGLLPSFIRIARTEDTALLSQWMSSPRYSEFCGYTPVYFYSYRLEQSLKDSIQSEKSIFFLVNEDPLGQGKEIGFMALSDVDLIHKKAEASTYFEKSGGFSKALYSFYNYAFCTLGLRKLKAEVIENNQRVISILEKNGYHFEGRCRSKVFRHGKTWDTLLYGIFEEDFQKMKKFTHS